MRVVLNLLWMLCGGLLSSLGWLIFGCLWCVTIIGLPVGLQCFKLSSMSLNPFGKETITTNIGAVSFLMNVAWFVLGGLELALLNFMIGFVLCITIIGIPFGKQFFKIAGLSLHPFGIQVIRTHVF
ncbi:MAG: YccF domain-containing protein [Solobacterium sp.]|nr:YccF domain-containing protein [Solobacterium sp.]